jgi:hypothetical protein
MSWERRLTLTYPFAGARPHLLDEELLRRWIAGWGPPPASPSIADFEPVEAYAGTAMVITGFHFSPTRADNQVSVGGLPAFVVEASENRLFVLTDALCRSGPVEVSVAGVTVTGPQDFVVKPWPAPGRRDAAPPYSFEGRGLPGSGPGGAGFPGGDPNTAPGAGDIPPTGTARVLVVLANPTDMVPANPAQVRNDVVATFGNVHTFYDQVSYGTLDVQVDVTTFVPLLENADYYHRANGAAGYPNIDWAVHEQLAAEAAQGAVDQGFDLDDYLVMAVLVHLPGLAVRAWGGWSQQNFAYNDGAGTAINLVADSPLAMIFARHDANWGRAAHEFGHSLVDGGQVLPEDVYASDLVDPSAATAQMFEMMGSHDTHPLFSGFYLDQLDYYSSANILELQWDRNPFSGEYLVTAHGLVQDSAADRVHLIRIKVSPGLDYYVEVRQRPPAGSAQVFDTNIPIPGGSTRTGGVIVTKALAGQQYNNQQMRLITLLHDPAVLLTGGIATDPLRGLQVTVVDDQVSTNPLTCKVRVEWAQQIGDTPGGDFDLSITPWGPGYESVDIWIDRMPFGTFDSVDSAGNPTGNGDVPKVLEVNRFWARVNNAGLAASNVRMTYYSVTPPGIGDNGTWTPMQTKILPAVPADATAQDFVNWVPTVGEHTCLKVVAEAQLGEQSIGNNQAQENVFTFQPAGNSVPEPVAMAVAVRNPLDTDEVVQVRITGVPQGYRVYLPHRWVELPPRGEMRMDLLIVPTADLDLLRADVMKVRRMSENKANDPWPRIRVQGQVPRGYLKAVDGEVPGSWYAAIGGISTRVEPKRLAGVKLAEDRESRDDVVAVRGSVSPAAAGQSVRVDLQGSDGQHQVVAVVTDSGGGFRAKFRVKRQRGPVLVEDRPVALPGRLGEDPNVRIRATDPARLGRLGDILARRTVTYQVQAHLIHAEALAPTSSNVVVVRRR